jgi:uncharacterized protein involved in exopolysaccharide biosynthesis
MNVPVGSSRSLFSSDLSVDPESSRLGTIQLKGLGRKHLLTIATCFIVVTTLVALALLWLPPTYVSTAKVLVQLDDMPNPAFFAGITPSRERVADDPANRQMENEMEMAEVWPVSAAAVRKLNLKYDDVYEAPLTKLLRPAGDLWDWFALNVLKLPRDPEHHGFADTLELFAKSYSVGTVASKSADTNSNIISFALQGTNAERTQKSLQAVLDAYIANAGELRQKAAENARQVVLGTAEEARTRAAEAQKRLDDFLSGAGNQGAANPTRSHAEAVELDRVVRLRQQELIDVQHRLSQIEIYLNLNANDIDHRVVIEPPLRPRSSEWKKRAIVGVAAAIGGLLLGVFLAGLREFFDHRLSNAAAVKAYLDLPVIAAIPNLKAKHRADVVNGPRVRASAHPAKPDDSSPQRDSSRGERAPSS